MKLRKEIIDAFLEHVPAGEPWEIAEEGQWPRFIVVVKTEKPNKKLVRAIEAVVPVSCEVKWKKLKKSE